MARNVLKNVMKLVDSANNELPIEKQFLNDLTASIEKSVQLSCRIPSKTYKPSSMNCTRQMVYQVLGVEPEDNSTSYQLQGICESGTDRHIRIQQAIENMKNVLNVDCEYIDIEEFINRRGIEDIEIVGKDGMETKLFHTKYNMSFMCDGIIKYKSKYFIFEFKTETSNKFYKRQGVDESHYNQATAYSLAFGIDNVLFVYENRDTLDKKAYIRNVTNDMRKELIEKIEYCMSCEKTHTLPSKPEDVLKKTCSYCKYRNRCERDGYYECVQNWIT